MDDDEKNYNTEWTAYNNKGAADSGTNKVFKDAEAETKKQKGLYDAAKKISDADNVANETAKTKHAAQVKEEAAQKEIKKLADADKVEGDKKLVAVKATVETAKTGTTALNTAAIADQKAKQDLFDKADKAWKA